MQHYTFSLALTYKSGFTTEKNLKYRQHKLIFCKVYLLP